LLSFTVAKIDPVKKAFSEHELNKTVANNKMASFFMRMLVNAFG